jgi:2-phosphosulfolactate phosphatase
MANTVRICLTPALYDLYRSPGSVVVVVDILRATTAICTALAHGARNVIAVASVEEALVYQNQSNVILAAERGGEIVPGFPYGNSPLAYVNNPEIVGKTLVMSTTNGTQAIAAAAKDGEVLIGCFGNLSELVHHISKINKDLLILCSGWKGRFNLEDTLFAGALAEKILNFGYAMDSDSDAVIAATQLYGIAKNDMHTYLKNTSHHNRLFHLNLNEDVDYCLKQDHIAGVPALMTNHTIQL